MNFETIIIEKRITINMNGGALYEKVYFIVVICYFTFSMFK